MTAASDKIESGEKNIECDENEVELVEYLRVIWKWKFKILVVALIFAVVSGVISNSTPQFYRVEIILKLNEINRTYGIPHYIDSPQNIAAMLEYSLLHREIEAYLRSIKNRNNYNISKLKVNRPGKGNFLQISYETPDAQLGVEILNSLKPVILHKYKEKIEFLQSDFQNYNTKKGEIFNLETEMEVLRTNIENLSKRINNLQSDLDMQMSNLQLTINKRDQLIDENNSTNVLLVILHNNTIQQNTALIHSIKNDLFRYISDRNLKKAALKNTELKFTAQRGELKAFESAQNNFQYIQVIRLPENSIQPIKAKTQRYVLFGFVLGLFIMISLSFFMDFILKPRSKRDL